ncbi:MAG: ribonuclease [Ilumatobacteraceae bacterium]|nr:ribonuclease [Ilumatobacteraceae bacterium]
MTAEHDGGVTDIVLTAAAAGLLALGVVTARGEPRRPDLVARPTDVSPLLPDQPGIKGRVERLQARFKPFAFLLAAVKKFGSDQASKLAALVAYYGFFSLFPALLALVTILGFVLEGHDALRNSIRGSALAQFPVIGESIGAAAERPLTGNTFALVIGLLAALWAGMGAMQAAQDAMNTVWDVPREQQPGFVSKRLRSLGGLVLMAFLFTATAFVPRAATAFTSGVIGWTLALASTMALDTLAILGAFRLFTTAKVHWHDLLPGAVVAGVVYVVLQSLGTLYVTHTLKGAQKTYGTFAGVIGLLSWMYLLAQVTMFAAEINVVRARRLWPRSLFEERQVAGSRRAAAAAPA